MIRWHILEIIQSKTRKKKLFDIFEWQNICFSEQKNTILNGKKTFLEIWE